MLRRIDSLLDGLRKVYREFPRRFWGVVGVSFIDSVGATLLFPFFALYITEKFSVGMTEAGLVLGTFSIASFVGGMIGGALTDRLGRKKLILFGLVASAITTLSLGLIGEFYLLFPVALIIGVFADVAGPAHQAMIADILPEEQRQEGFGMMRVVRNMAWIIGPSIGGFLANVDFFLLFVTDALVSCLAALLFFVYIPETKPAPKGDEKPESMLQTFAGYAKVLRDSAFVWFIVAMVLMILVYGQMYNSLSVFLRDVYGIPPQGFGFLLTSSAVVVILFQFWTTRAIKSRPPFLMMALGSLFYMLGFGMFGFVSAYFLFVTAIAIVTIGEMIVMPTSAALAANFAPEAMRGRYMAIFGLVWVVPFAVGPTAAGYILDNFDPNLLWHVGGILCTIAALAFYLLHLRLGKRERFAPAAAPGATPAAE
ncbi:MAG: MFS transporter [Anaerolineales bacterium]